MAPQKSLTEFFSSYELNLKKAIDKYRSDKQFLRYFELGITLLVIAFFVFMAIKPAVVTISGLVGEIKQKKILATKMEEKINTIIAAQEEYAVVQAQAILIDEFLPPDVDLSFGISQVAGAVKDSQLAISGISLDQVEMVTNMSKEESKVKKEDKKIKNLFGLGFSMSMKGDYFSLRNFVDRILDVRRWLALEEYQIVPGKEDEAPGTLVFSGSGRLFYWLNWLDKKEGVSKN